MLSRHAVILVLIGRLTDAQEIYDKLRAEHDFNLHDEEGFRVALLRYDLELRCGRAGPVIDTLRHVGQIFEERGWSVDVARCFMFQARAAIALDRMDEAEHALARAEQLAADGHAFAMVVELLLVRSALERTKGAFVHAVASADEALHLASSRQMRLSHIDALVARALAVFEVTRSRPQPNPVGNNLRSVVDDAEAALRLGRGCGYVWAERDALALLADLRQHGGDPATAASFRAEADAITQRLTLPPRRRGA